MKKQILALAVITVLATLGCFRQPVSDRFAPLEQAQDTGAPAVARGQAPVVEDLGYATAFKAEMQKVGPISAQEFGNRYGGKTTYLAQLDWDPTTATFFDRFSADPSKKGAMVRARGAEERMLRESAKSQGKPIPEHEPVMIPINAPFDFRLNDAETTKFKKNGFVVSERLGTASCTDMFYRIYKRDLPVLITSDAILHAWHRSYDALLEEVETSMLIPALDEILTAMAEQVPKAESRYGNGLFNESVRDADYFIAVARSLLADTAITSRLNQDGQVQQTIKACREQQMQHFTLFGSLRVVDFSQFKPRGHYEKSEQLRRYFRAMMWCGRIDLRVAGNPNESTARQLASAVVLHDLLQQSGKFALWSKFDRVLQTFVGQADSMTFAQLDSVLAAARIRSPLDVKDAATLDALAVRIGAGDLGAQEIVGDVFVADPQRPGTAVLPRSFAFLGQRFVVDSWATSQVVHDSCPVLRRIPSCLDVSFAVFANDHTVPLLLERLTNPNGRKFRDGLAYQQNLAAVRGVLDGKSQALWQQNLYTGWLGCLRELSKPTTGDSYPAAMRTQAWAMKTLNTQHASWTQLRHDTILYVKQSYTITPLCYYPAGYVEPIPHFWERLERMVARAADLIDETPYPNDPNKRAQHARFLRAFAGTVKTLHGIAEKELAQKELNKEETKFLEDVVEVIHERFGSGSRMRFAGWYPALYYRGAEDSMKWDALVADVHTNPPAPLVGDPGCVLHQGVGFADMLMLAVDSGKDRMVFAGPVLSHYEFELAGVARMADSEWKKDLQAGKAPPRPEWTRSYLVPGENPAIKGRYATD